MGRRSFAPLCCHTAAMLHSSPEEYGFTVAQTLAHRVRSSPPAGFAAYWATFREEIETLSTRWEGLVDAPVNQLLIRSTRDVRVAAQLRLPTESPVGVVVTTHGYTAPDDFPSGDPPWAERGLATLRLRVRGFPPSTADLGDLRGQWILHKLGVADAWIMRGAVADLVQAVRCTQRHFGEQMPIMLHGESFGGGLAVIAAAQLERLGDPPVRLGLGLPSFGDWRWRADHFCNGAGGLVNDALVGLREDREVLMQSLLLFDAAHHAARVTITALCKLAERDDVVPAPSAAAVFHGLASPRKWRYVVPYGHFDGGIAAARQHVVFQRLLARYLDPRETPERPAASTADASNA